MRSATRRADVTRRRGRPRVHQARPPRTLIWAPALGLPLLLIVGLALSIARSHQEPQVNGRSPTGAAVTTSAWQDRADVAFSAFAGGLVRLARDGAEWRAGTLSDAQFASSVSSLVPQVAAGTERVGELPALTVAPRAKPLLVASAQLYTECLRVTESAIGQRRGDLRHQLDLIGQRVRILGDRVYDRARVAVDPNALGSLGSGAVEVHLPPDVPDWADTGLAAGPPLAAVPPPSAEVPAEREPSRPQQPEAAWRQGVEAADIPSAAQLVEAIRTGDPTALGVLATRLDAAAVALGNLADPPHGRERAAIVRLGLLVDAEAARTAQAAALIGAGTSSGRSLVDVSRRLVVLGDGLWDPALPPRVSDADRAFIASPSP